MSSIKTTYKVHMGSGPSILYEQFFTSKEDSVERFNELVNIEMKNDFTKVSETFYTFNMSCYKTWLEWKELELY